MPDYPRWSEAEIQAMIAASGVKPMTEEAFFRTAFSAEEAAGLKEDDFLEAGNEWRASEKPGCPTDEGPDYDLDPD